MFCDLGLKSSKLNPAGRLDESTLPKGVVFQYFAQWNSGKKGIGLISVIPRTGTGQETVAVRCGYGKFCPGILGNGTGISVLKEINRIILVPFPLRQKWMRSETIAYTDIIQAYSGMITCWAR
jgi:hypothetical protein